MGKMIHANIREEIQSYYFASGKTPREIATKYNIHRSTVERIIWETKKEREKYNYDCKVSDCNNTRFIWGFCRKHWRRLRKNNSLELKHEYVYPYTLEEKRKIYDAWLKSGGKTTLISKKYKVARSTVWKITKELEK